MVDDANAFSAQVSHGQAQQASEAHANDLKDTIRLGVEEANDLRAQLATVVPRQQLRDAEGRIKVCIHRPVICKIQLNMWCSLWGQCIHEAKQ